MNELRTYFSLIRTDLCLMPDFKKYQYLPAPPEDVYNALTNPLALQLWTGERAEMSTEPDSEFSLWDESIVGKNLKFETNKLLIQQWYFEGETDESLVTLKLHPEGEGTSLEVRHINIPKSDFEDIQAGWLDLYLPSLLDFFQE